MTDHQALPPFAAWAGPRQPKMLLVGEAFGESEEGHCQPFVGSAGQELWRMLGEASDQWPDEHRRAAQQFRYGPYWIKKRQPWLDMTQIAMTNVFNLRPLANKVETICHAKPTPGPQMASGTAPIPPLARGNYLQPQYLPELARLYGEISLSQPNLIVALGATAAWACLRATNIGSIRGSVAGGVGLPGILDPPTPWPKVLPTYHPAGVLRNWAWRSIVIADLMKAFRECEYPEIRRPERQVLVNPTLLEIQEWVEHTIEFPPLVLSADIETAKGQITCFGFASSASGSNRPDSMVVSFWNPNTNQSYWQTAEQEVCAWLLVKRLLESQIPKLFQNGMYDLQYILKMGIRPRNCIEDSMLMHHSLHPEMLKGLGFLGSIYSSESSWKLMRKHKADTEKRDE